MTSCWFPPAVLRLQQGLYDMNHSSGRQLPELEHSLLNFLNVDPDGIFKLQRKILIFLKTVRELLI